MKSKIDESLINVWRVLDVKGVFHVTSSVHLLLSRK